MYNFGRKSYSPQGNRFKQLQKWPDTTMEDSVLGSKHHGSQGATLMSTAALCKKSRENVLPDHMGAPSFLRLRFAIVPYV